MSDVKLTDWIGRTETAVQTISDLPVRGMAAAAYDRGVDPKPGDVMPYLSHWLHFLPIVPMSGIDVDGHPKRGGFLPPVPLERRMWAGGRLTFHDDLRIGDEVTKESEILKVAEKSGSVGSMVFVTVRHRLSTSRGLAIDEEQDIVYVAMPTVAKLPEPVPAPAGAVWSEPYRVDPVLLFRFSALTFNAHRIHYDLPYAREREFYPGLVVHGPLQAMLLLDMATRRQGARPASFSFRGVRPLFHFDEVTLLGLAREDGGHDLVTATGEGHSCMQARVSWKT